MEAGVICHTSKEMQIHMYLVLIIQYRDGQIVFRPSCPTANHSPQCSCPAVTLDCDMYNYCNAPSYVKIRLAQWPTIIETLVSQ